MTILVEPQGSDHPDVAGVLTTQGALEAARWHKRDALQLFDRGIHMMERAWARSTPRRRGTRTERNAIANGR